MSDSVRDHWNLPLRIYTTRDKMRLYFIDFLILFSLSILLHTMILLQWKQWGVWMDIELQWDNLKITSHATNFFQKSKFLDGR